MIVKNKKEKKESHWILFLIILLFSGLIIYCIINNNSIRIKTIIPFGHIGFLYLLDLKFYFLIIIIVFNFGNIYQTLLLFYSLIIPDFLFSTFLFFIGYGYEYDKQNKLNILYDYFILIFFFLIIAKFLFYSNNINEQNINYKGLFIYIIIFIFLLLCLTNTIAILNSNIIFIDKIISGFLLSYSYYFLIFHVININPNDSLQLFYFIEKSNNNIITVAFFIMIIISIYLKNDNKYNKFLSCILYITSNIIPIYGIIYEYKFLFNSSRKNWANFNFEKENNIENDNLNSLISEISITKSIKWNKTSFIIDILRLIVLIFIQIIIFYFSEQMLFFNYNEVKINKSFLFFVFSIFTFIIDKILLYWLRLINMTYFFLERNSINSR
jgi:hypothetical protein